LRSYLGGVAIDLVPDGAIQTVNRSGGNTAHGEGYEFRSCAAMVSSQNGHIHIRPAARSQPPDGFAMFCIEQRRAVTVPSTEWKGHGGRTNTQT